MTFWTTATTEQKLAQIDGGIECGMNSTQIAMNCGADPVAVRNLVRTYGRAFPHTGVYAQGVHGREYNSRRSSVEATKRMAARTGTLGNAAFSIFEPANNNDGFLPEWEAF